MPDAVPRIDVHHHIIPKAFVQAADRHGVKEVAGAPLPDWSAERSLDVMDANAIGTALLSLSAPGVWFGDRDEACALARACNEESARVRADHPGRFGQFAVLPMPLVEESCREVEYAFDSLDADGIVLLGSTEGVFLGDPRLEELMAELNRRRAVVFVHPNLHPTSRQLGLDIPGFFVEFLCDTTRAATNLIFSGALHRHPDIRFVLAHGGGFLPYIAWRLSLANSMPSKALRFPDGMHHEIRRFYFDTALSASPQALGTLTSLVDPSHILFGSDFPFAPAAAVATETHDLDRLDVIGPEVGRGIRRDNAVALFPRFADGVDLPSGGARGFVAGALGAIGSSIAGR